MLKKLNPLLDDPIENLYIELLSNWNNQNSLGMSELFSEQGIIVGFDGSTITGKNEINAHLTEIFTHHKTATYVAKIKSIQSITSEVFMLQGIAGMIPPEKKEIYPRLNVIQTLVASKKQNKFQIELFQNTHLAFHMNKQLKKDVIKELKELV